MLHISLVYQRLQFIVLAADVEYGINRPGGLSLFEQTTRFFVEAICVMPSGNLLILYLY
jgi:hypothetical protein